MPTKNTLIGTLILIGLVWSIVMCSQSRELPNPDTNAFPRLSIQNDSIDIEISAMQVGVKVFGNIAITSYDITFFNPSERVLEGELNFPLKANQEIVEFSMDVDGQLRKGVVVEKDKGRQVFETIVREGIDPGLVEKTSGNNFRARVYPILAKSTKRLVITCQEELALLNSDYIYHLPMGFHQVIEDFSIKVEVVKGMKKPAILQNDFTFLNFETWEDAFVAEATHKTIHSTGLFSVMLPSALKKDMVIKSDDGQYFYATLPIHIDAKPKVRFNHINLLWDISGSGINRGIDKELALLSAYLKYHENVKVSLTTFNHLKQSTTDYIVQNGIATELVNALKALQYDGGSRIENIPFNQLDGQEILLFTDGLINLGELAIVPCYIPLSIVNSSLKANHTQLYHLAKDNKGCYIDLSSLSTPEAIKALTDEQVTAELENQDSNTSDVVVNLSPNRRQLIITGKVHSPEAQLTVNLYNGSQKMEHYEIPLSEKDSYRGLPVGRLWASQKINSLMSDKQKNKQEIISLAKKHGVVTDFTSLMVLERLEDYVRFEIEPPSEWKEDYHKIMQQKKEVETQNQNHSVEPISSYINEYKKWWHTNFPLTKQFPKSKLNQSYDLIDEEEIPITRQEESTPPPPPPAVSDVLFCIVEDDLELEEAAYDMPPRKERRLQISTNAIPWDSTATYMAAVTEFKDSEVYVYYNSIKTNYLLQPSFYLDIASYLFKINRTDEAVAIITNIAELQLENVEILRIVGHKLIQQNQLELGILVFRKIKNLRPEELQSYRDLALALEKADAKAEAVNLMIAALQLQEIRGNFAIKEILLNELNGLFNRHPEFIDTANFPAEWRYNMPVSIRIVLSWSTDYSDVDLWIVEPTGEKCLYSNNRTWLGGRLSQDITNGYGPEEYLIKVAKPGAYKIQANYYGDNRPSLSGPITLYAEIFQNYGRANQSSSQIVLQLKDRKQVIDLGEIIVK